MNFIISTATDIGTTKATNQDSFNARVMTTPLGRMAFAVVCDGMGGLDKGEVASASVVNAFCKWAEQRLPDLCESGLTDSAVRADWVGIATEYNEKIKLYGKRCGLASGPVSYTHLDVYKRQADLGGLQLQWRKHGSPAGQ